MNALLRAEIIKLRSVRMPVWLLLAALGLVVLLVSTTVPTNDAPGNDLSLHWPGLLARVVGVGSAGGEVIVLVLGILAVTQELRFGTITATYLATPARDRVLGAKTLALTLAGLVFAVATVALAVIVSAGLIAVHGGTVRWSGQLLQVMAGGLLVMALYGAIGVAIGAVVRNQVGAIVGAVIWVLVVEQLLINLAPGLGRWMPTAATAGVLQLGSSETTHGSLLAAPTASLVLIVWTLAFGLLARAVTLRRDVT